MTRFRVLGVGSVAGAAATTCFLLAAAGCGPKSAAQSEADDAVAVEVAVTTPRTVEIPRLIHVTGTLRGDEETTVAAQVAGEIVEILKDLGDPAAPGEPLLRVDPTDYELAKEERARAFHQALARLGLSSLPEGALDVDALPAVERARLEAENAKRRYERSEELLKTDPPTISEQDLADLRTSWQMAESFVRVQRLAAEATLAEARTLDAQLKIAERKLAETVHRAPEPAEEASIGGSASMPRYRVAERLVSVGDYVQVGTPLYRLVVSDPIRVRAAVPERDLDSVRVGQEAVVRVEAYPQPFEGTVARVSPSVDVRSRTFTIEIRIANPDGRLRPGSFASAELRVGSAVVLAVPAEAIVTFAGVHKVVLVEEGKANEQRVELGDANAGLVEVRSGLRGDESIVRQPPGSLVTGTPVTIRVEGAPGGSDAEAR